jgi:hypothetical protein
VTPRTKQRRINRLPLGILLGAMTASLLMTFGAPAVPNRVATVATHVGAPVSIAQADASTNPDDWSTSQYDDLSDPTLGDNGRAGFNPDEHLSPVPGQLQVNPQWLLNNGNPGVAANGTISIQPVVSSLTGQPVVYWGGVERLRARDGGQ